MLTNATDGTESESRARNRAALVGLSLCSYDEQSALDLQSAQLLLLEELARQAHDATDDVLHDIAATTGVDPQLFRDFVSELRSRHSLPRVSDSGPNEPLA